MKEKFIIFSFVTAFFLSAFSAQSAMPSTTFDDRTPCEESKGIWREFGNGCTDRCNPKLDKFSICTQAITFGCDCGKGRCWNGESCVLMSDYKKIFAVEQAKEAVILEEAKKKRVEAAKENQDAIMSKMVTKATAAIQPLDPTGKTPMKNNFGEFFKPVTPAPAPNAPSSVPPPQNNDEPQSPITEILAPQIPPQAAPIVVDQNNASVPPAFLQQENAKKKTAEQNSGKANINSSVPPGLPLIPLPN